MQVREVVCSLHSLLATLGAREEIWSVGRLARHVGDQLEAWTPARTRRKQAGGGGVSLVLVDRTLDLASAVMQTGDTLLGRATQLLDRLPGHTIDTAVGVRNVLQDCVTHVTCCRLVLPGCSD